MCKFSSNTAYKDGGAMAVTITNAIVITNVIFVTNIAKVSGGGLYFETCDNINSKFLYMLSNKAVYFLSGEKLTFKGCMFTKNDAGSGGALVTKDLVVLKTVSTYFVEIWHCFMMQGLYILKDPPFLSIQNVFFVSNNAKQLGVAMYITGERAKSKC